ncbi:MAG: glycosyltransferase family 9 protein [Planctomycetota bacterium]
MGHRTRKSRVRLFCEAAGVPPGAPRLRIADADRHWAEGWLAGRGRDADRPLVGLQPISCGVRRNWPRPAWAELARRLRGRGADVVVFHSFPAPVRGIEGIVAAGLPLPKAAAVVAACDLLVTPDSGFLHLGAALDRPLITLWGSINPHAVCEFYPRAERRGRPAAPRRATACAARSPPPAATAAGSWNRFRSTRSRPAAWSACGQDRRRGSARGTARTKKADESNCPLMNDAVAHSDSRRRTSLRDLVGATIQFLQPPRTRMRMGTFCQGRCRAGGDGAPFCIGHSLGWRAGGGCGGVRAARVGRTKSGSLFETHRRTLSGLRAQASPGGGGRRSVRRWPRSPG